MNYIKQVAKMLGVEVEEEFNILDGNKCLLGHAPYKLTTGCGLVDNGGDRIGTVLHAILRGEYTIQKLPWKPKVGERFYYVEVGGSIIADKFDCFYASRMNLYKMGNCFRTMAEAEENREKIARMYDEIKEELA